LGVSLPSRAINIMKLHRYILIMLSLLAASALATEQYDATINAKSSSGKGKEKTFSFRLKYDKTEGEAFTGEVSSYGSGPCAVGRKVSGIETAAGEFRFNSEEAELAGCGKLVFRGKRENDSTIIGKMRFQGEDHEFVFKK
jgi:hypothetical protein